MKIMEIKNAISFKSGYPTFGGCGHLRAVDNTYSPVLYSVGTTYNPNIYENKNPFFRPNPNGLLDSPNKLDIFA